MSGTPLPVSFFARPAVTVAAELVGALLTVDGTGGIIAETEAYDAAEPASHSFNGPTPRNAAMFGPPACAYVYRSYGIHWCFNIVCLPGSAVLIRALVPTHDVATMRQRRGLDDERLLCAGPGRLCQALAIDRALDARPVIAPPFSISASAKAPDIVSGPRIGISKAVDLPWRYGLAGSRYLSKRFV
jgi:DNA-3-methyladenine glycosylase